MAYIQQSFRFEKKTSDQLDRLVEDEDMVYTSKNEVARHAINQLHQKHYE